MWLTKDGTSNSELARRGFDAIAPATSTRSAELLDPDVKWHGGDPTPRAAAQNRNQALAGCEVRRAGAVDRCQSWSMWSGPATVSSRSCSHHPRADDPAPRRTANLATFRNGKVVEMVHYDDAADALSALGPP